MSARAGGFLNPESPIVAAERPADDEAIANDSETLKLFTDAVGETFEELIPESAQGGYQRALRGTASPRSAIKAFCLHCVGYVRADVKNCTATKCPLHRYRPFQVTRSKP